ncbi:MAG TPA: DHHA1 domain-containing protein [Candidatus Bathyarchaeia archaeon]|nr:DHHA1 domain-containing protein [Candidatus Bathyarchaeia archaeon]
MATRRLYYDDSFLRNFTARILSCSPVAPVSTPSGAVPVWEVLLDQTALYPTSGGQPNDLGMLGEARILDVRDEGEEIAHLVDRELHPGDVDGCVDWPRRFDHMQQHTGQHLLSAMFHERFGLPTVSFHLGSDLCTIDLRGPEPSADALRGAQRAANAIVFEDRPVNVRYGTADEFAERGVRKEVDREGILRAIEIEAADLQPCGGTHVKSTGQIGLILVRRCTKIRQDWRVEFVCGGRADRIATGDFQLLRTIGDQLSCAPEETPEAIEKASAERDASFKSLRTALQQLAEGRAQLRFGTATPLAGGARLVTEVLREENPDLLLPLATELAKNDKVVALLCHEPTGQLVFAQSPAAGRDLSSLLKQVFATIPGKGGGTLDFVRAKLSDPSQSSAALSLAAQLLAA